MWSKFKNLILKCENILLNVKQKKILTFLEILLKQRYFLLYEMNFLYYTWKTGQIMTCYGKKIHI